MIFDPWNCSMNIWESTGTPTPKMGVALGVWKFIPSHFLTVTLSYTLESMRCDSWGFFLVRTLASPCFGREPKARVVTPLVIKFLIVYTNKLMKFYKFVPTMCEEWKDWKVFHSQSSTPTLNKEFQLHSKSCKLS